jgi:hypothetical protein
MAHRSDLRARQRWLGMVGLIAAAGCYVTAPIKPSELTLLDGYHDGEPKGGTVSVLSPDNKPTEIAENSQIFIDTSDGTYGGTFKSIRVTDGIFRGVKENGEAMQVPLGAIQAARVAEPNRSARGPFYAIMVVGGGVVALLVVGIASFVLQGYGCTETHPCKGRALRVARQVVTAPAIDADGWAADLPAADTAPPSPELRAALVHLWVESARGEHASVPAFSRLALSLVAVGAPARLVEAAHWAALDEINHARLSFSLASAYAGEPVGPGPLPELRQAPAVTASSLAELSAESLIDGCLLEGAAAEVARRALLRARDPRARAALAVIAPDEASHAALAWDIVRWCCDQGGDPVRRALSAALENAPPSVTPPRIPEVLADALADHGCLGAGDWDEAFRNTAAVVAARVAALGAG